MLRVEIYATLPERKYRGALARIGWLEAYNKGPTSEEEAADSKGERFYDYQLQQNDEPIRRGSLRHRRSDGAWSLVGSILRELGL